MHRAFLLAVILSLAGTATCLPVRAQYPNPGQMSALEAVCYAGHLLNDAKIDHTIYTLHTNNNKTIELCTWHLNNQQYVYQYEMGTYPVPDKDPSIYVNISHQGLVTSTEQVSDADAEATAQSAIQLGKSLNNACLVYASAMYSKCLSDTQPNWIAIMVSPATDVSEEDKAKGFRPTRHAVLLWEKDGSFYRTDTINPMTEKIPTDLTAPGDVVAKFFKDWTLNNEQGG